MKIKVAEHTGFCMGVRKAVLHIVHEIEREPKTIHVYGPLIHNPQTIAVLHSRGVKTIESLENINDKIVTIRTHGIPKDSLNILKKKASRIINLTCPRVARVQGIVKKYSNQGFYTLIIGDIHHAEVESVKSYAESGVQVISTIHDIDIIPKADKYIIVAQTTFDELLFDQITKNIISTYPDVLIFNTICDSTHKRQNDVINAIADGIDTLIVVGGKNSANTQRLASIGINNNIKTFHIETEDELKDNDFKDSKYVLITAGASTPGWIINNCLEKLFVISNKYKNPLLKLTMRILEISTRLNIISSLASFFMTLLMEYALNMWSYYKLPALSALFIFVMYAINNYFLKDTLKITNPAKFRLHKDNHYFILTATIISIAFSMYITTTINSFYYLIGYYMLFSVGIIYSTPQFHLVVKNHMPSLIKNLYYIRTVPAIFGWITVTLLLPIVYAQSFNSFDIEKSFYVVPLMMFMTFLIVCRNLFLDLIGYGADLIIGNITLPRIIGINNIRNICYGFSLLSTSSIIALSLFYNIVFLLFLLNIILYGFLLMKVIKLKYFISLKYEITTDANFTLFIFICILLFGV